MKKIVYVLLLVLSLAVPSYAQTKPYGAFDVGERCENVPSWITFSGLPNYYTQEQFNRAARCSRERGMLWVLKFGFDSVDPVLSRAIAAKAKMDRAGLTPYVIAVQFNEEWYGQAMTGVWGPPSYELMDWIAAFGGEQQRVLKQVFGLPSIYIDAFVNSNRIYGLEGYRPLPPHTDLFGIETYVPNGGTWEQNVQPYVDYTIATTTQPIVLIGQTFKHPTWWGDTLSNGPSKRDGQKFKELLQHPRMIAAWLFTWRDRDNGIRGGQSMPEVVSWFR